MAQFLSNYFRLFCLSRSPRLLWLFLFLDTALSRMSVFAPLDTQAVRLLGGFIAFVGGFLKTVPLVFLV
jgi:hypothetical protein